MAASEELDQEALAKLFSEEHLFAMPILDKEGRMKGIVTADDIVKSHAADLDWIELVRMPERRCGTVGIAHGVLT